MCAIFIWRISGAFVAQNAVFHASMMCPDASILMLKHAIEGSGAKMVACYQEQCALLSFVACICAISAPFYQDCYLAVV